MGVSDNLQDEIHDENVIYDENAYRVKKDVEKLPVEKEIVLDDIVYKYPNSEALIFDHAHMEIPVGTSVGIVGTSGAGKTTIVDIMLGLLQISEGSILADGVEVRDHYESWLKNIGYIPQNIFMVDSTIRKNVAFGCADEEIDDAKVWEALKKASLDEFVRGFPRVWIRASGRGGSAFPEGSVRGSASPGPCMRIRKCWCWTKPPALWTTIPRRPSWSPSTACTGTRLL